MQKNIINSLLILAAVLVVGYVIVNKVSEDSNPGIDNGVQGKLDINAICEDALAYMSFPDGVVAQMFVDECKEGKHPGVIEEFKKRMNLGDGASL